MYDLKKTILKGQFMKAFSFFSKGLITISVLSGLVHATEDLGHPIPSEKDIILTFGNASATALTNRINMLVWNLHKGADESFSTDYASLSYQKDIIMAQEMYLTPLMKGVFASFPDQYFVSATSFLLGNPLTRTGVLNSSRVLPSSYDYVRTQTLEPIVNSPKVTLITRYPIRSTNAVLTTVNIHGINFVDAASYQKEINRIYDAIKDTKGPLVFAGDFNSWSDERDSILKVMRQKLNLNEAKFSPDERMTFNGHPLDHFFYTNDIKIISAKVEGFYQGSDHKPLEVIFEYSPRPKVRKIDR